MLSKMIISTSMHLKEHFHQPTIRVTLQSCIHARSGWSRSKHTMSLRNMRTRTRVTRRAPDTSSRPSLKIAAHSMTSSRRSWKLTIASCSPSITSRKPIFTPLWISSQIRQLRQTKYISPRKRASANMKKRSIIGRSSILFLITIIYKSNLCTNMKPNSPKKKPCAYMENLKILDLKKTPPIFKPSLTI